MSSIKSYTVLLALLWTALIGALLFLNVRDLQKNPVLHAELQASAQIDSAINFRSWAAHFGGVYVHPTEKYPPNPYLKTPRRDITTTDGERLTLINPAYMTRQVFNDFSENGQANGHITSLKLLNPNNAPDAWERKALMEFEVGETKASVVEVTSDGRQIFRYMKPLYIKENCLGCHKEQGYKIGDVRGGISTFIDLSKGKDIVANSTKSLIWTYGVVWLVGIAGILFSFRRSIALEVEREQKISLMKVSSELAQEFISGMSELSNLDETLQALSLMLEKRDPYTSGHQRRVADLAERIAIEMGLSKDQAHGIRLAGIVHDIGKIQTPSDVLTKPGKLSDIEFSLMKLHPQAGFDILSGIKFPWPIAKAVQQHHERLDGSGYPSSLKGDEIIIDARIIGVADVVEAMSSHRPYRPGLGIDAALAEIVSKRGSYFDADAVDACLRLFKERGYQFP